MKKYVKQRAGRAAIRQATRTAAARGGVGRETSVPRVSLPLAPQANKPPGQARHSKKEAVLALLRRPEGATLTELMNATGWQAHSVRGFISGTARKALGLTVTTKHNEQGVRSYRVV